ncbi:hypothetical protein SynBIOSE41_00097 [Synechococcus sp. BIOS-E4-1]|nr:hypothetical protein SynBIOSE41_00097 [Synechococcus sp. BIOS-E4-1]
MNRQSKQVPKYLNLRESYRNKHAKARKIKPTSIQIIIFAKDNEQSTNSKNQMEARSTRLSRSRSYISGFANISG